MGFTKKEKVWFMKDNKPCKGIIEAKLIIDGAIELEFGTIKIGSDDEEKTFYKIGDVYEEESNLFRAKDDLKNSLFN